jgi:uncharacterized protein DUF4292
MKNFCASLALSALLSVTQLLSYGQVKPTHISAAASSSTREVKPAASKAALELARAAYGAQGGEKFRGLKSYSLSGIGFAISPMFPDPVPMQFTLVATNDRIRIDAEVAFGTIQLINDGKKFYNLVNGAPGSFGLAPPAKFGLNVLAKYDRPGYSVAVLTDQKQSPGFKITDSDGNATDFYVDSKTGRIVRSVYKFNDLSQEWEFADFKEIEGAFVPQNFVIKMEAKAGTYLLSFNASEAKINQPVSDDTFIP